MKAPSTEMRRLDVVLDAVYGDVVYMQTSGRAPVALILADAKRQYSEGIERGQFPSLSSDSKAAIIEAISECVVRAIAIWRGTSPRHEPSWRIGESSDLSWWESAA